MQSRDWAILAVILVIGAGLRIARIDYDSLTFDEQWHLELSTGRGSPHVRVEEDKLIKNAPAVTSLVDAPPWYAVWTNMDFVVHPPLYCTLLRLWREVFGAGDIPARAFSILCSLLTIALMFFATRELNGVWTATWAALIFAVAPEQVFLAQQVRGYELLQAFGVGAVWSLVRLEKSENSHGWPSVGLGICVLCLMLTHYFAIGICAAISTFVLIRLRGTKLRDALIALGISAIVYAIIWGPFFLKQRKYFKETADPWLIENIPEHFIRTLQRLATAPWRLALPIDSSWAFITAIAVGILLLVTWIILLFKRSDLLLWGLWLLGTIGLLTMLDFARQTRHLDFPRYMAFATPAICVLFSGAFARIPWAQHIAPAVVAIVLLFCSKAAYYSEEPDWRQVGKAIDQNVKPDEAILFYPGIEASWMDEVYYLGSAHYSHVFPHSMARLSKPASGELLKQMPRDTVWLISGRLVPERPFVNTESIAQVLPGATIIGQPVVLEGLVVCSHVQLNRENVP